MSVYGGDSWVPESMHRKRRLQDLLEQDVNEEEVRRLANGRIACLVCPHNPVLDTFLMLVMHRKGGRHQAAAERLREKEIWKQEEINKRIALASVSPRTRIYDRESLTIPSQRSVTCNVSSPLLETTRKRKAEVLQKQDYQPHHVCEQSSSSAKSRKQESSLSSIHLEPRRDQKFVRQATGTVSTTQIIGVSQQHLEHYKQRERDLKLREAGWRRDGSGGWFKEENVEFDSEDEAPQDVT